MKRRHRIYVASPYSNPDQAAVEANVARSTEAAAECMRRGHHAHSPLAATHPIAAIAPDVSYEQYMALDLSLIEHWATAILYLSPSPGADRELAHAIEYELDVYRSLDEVPDLRVGATA